MATMQELTQGKSLAEMQAMFSDPQFWAANANNPSITNQTATDVLRPYFVNSAGEPGSAGVVPLEIQNQIGAAFKQGNPSGYEWVRQYDKGFAKDLSSGLQSTVANFAPGGFLLKDTISKDAQKTYDPNLAIVSNIAAAGGALGANNPQTLAGTTSGATGGDAALYAGTEAGAQTPLWGGAASYGTDIAATDAALAGIGGDAALGGGTLAAVNAGGAASNAAAGGAVAGAAPTWGQVAGAVAPSVLGYMGSKDAQDQQQALTDKYMAMGEPYRGKLAELYNNPNAYLDTQRADIEKNVQRGTDIMSRSLSMGGNPVGSGNALQQLQSYASEGMDNQLYSRLNTEKNNLATFGGLTQFNTAAPVMANNAINTGQEAYGNLGYGAGKLADIFNPPKPTASDNYWNARKRVEGY